MALCPAPADGGWGGLCSGWYGPDNLEVVDSVRVPVMRAASEDLNGDARTDLLKVSAEMPLAEGEAWMNYGPESKARHLLRAESSAEFLRSLQKEMRNDELVVCVSHGAIMGTTVRNPGSSTPLPPCCSPLTSDLRACVGGRCVRCWASSAASSGCPTPRWRWPRSYP